ncbi:MAG: PVC-type heme-binding CxxCH protein [Phycisphaeraceae bacterium]
MKCYVMRMLPVLWLCLAQPVAAQPLVAPTEPLTPAQQQMKFKLPPGFEIQLVASEPTIGQPMNMNFDSRGRLWVTSSNEYPWPAADPARARDRLTVFTNIGPDGKPEKSHVFADKLNIPIGVVPLRGGKETIVWSIPHIWKMTDTDDDGVADKREILFGPFDYADTHGNQNAFRYHNDGWVYANHGFRNNSNQIKRGGQGAVVMQMNSGNTYRFKPDGSKIELWSAGQVNPFGLTFDEWGNLFSADCHSKPCTMVIRGAVYQSFGKPHDGLGFGPDMTNHNHGSSGIGGIAYYDAEQFPKEYRKCLYLGNVVTGVVQRDVIQWRGSTPWVDKPEPFITCDDPWFRPVDIQLGPDGALYIADFYNCIIGHYEVDLKHPRRDRERGRIWRVIYTGLAGAPKVPAAAAMQDLTKQSVEQLIERLGDKNIIVRNLATNELCDRIKDKNDVYKHVPYNMIDDDSTQLIHKLWVRRRFDGLPADATDWLSGRVSGPRVAAHVARIVGADQPNHAIYTIQGAGYEFLRDSDPQIVRAGAEMAGMHSYAGNIPLLFEAWEEADKDDTALIHTTRIALRNHLRDLKDLSTLSDLKLKDEQLAKLAEIALAVPTEAAAWFAFEYVSKQDVPDGELGRYLTHVARYVGPSRVNEVAAFVQKKYEGDAARQLALFQALYAGLSQRGTKVDADSAMGKWATSLVTTLLDPKHETKPAWTNHALDSAKPSRSPWGLRERQCNDGKKTLFFDSIVSGETLTGVLGSEAFEIPRSLSFFICGHNGLPGTNPEPVNHIRLKLVDGGEVIAKVVPPRNDTARKVTWDLSKWAGKQGVIEIVDASTLEAYAWIGVSRFEPAVVRNPAPGVFDAQEPRIAALGIIAQLQIESMRLRVFNLVEDRKVDASVRAAAAHTAFALGREHAAGLLGALVTSHDEPAALRVTATELVSRLAGPPEAAISLEMAVTSAPAALQREFAVAMASGPLGANVLLDSIELGKASPRLLQDKTIIERLRASKVEKLDNRIATLTRGLPAPDDRINQLIAQRTSGFASAKPDPSRGLELYKTHCAACHKIGELGGKVGPQLDGIATRGPARLLEDILDPNRNVDAALRAVIFKLNDGDLITGLKLREEGKLVVLADAQGKEIKVNGDDIAEARVSSLSPMPSNFADLMKEQDLYDLLAMLMGQGATK